MALIPVILATAIRQTLTVSRVKKEITERTNSFLLSWEKWGNFHHIFHNCLQTWSHLYPCCLLFTLVLAFRHLIVSQWFLALLSQHVFSSIYSWSQMCYFYNTSYVLGGHIWIGIKSVTGHVLLFSLVEVTLKIQATMYLTKDLYLEYIRNSQNSLVKRII